MFATPSLWKDCEEEDITRWPHPKEDLLHIVRVRLVGTQASLLNKFKELQIRAEIVRKLCLLYLERQWHILENNPGVDTIHRNEHCASPYESMKEHIRKTIEKNYPEEVHATWSSDTRTCVCR